MSPNRILVLDLLLAGCLAIAIATAFQAARRMRRTEEHRGPILVILAASLFVVAAVGALLAVTDRAAGYAVHPLVLVGLFGVVVIAGFAIADALFVRLPMKAEPWQEAVVVTAMLVLMVAGTVFAIRVLDSEPVATVQPEVPDTFGIVDAQYAVPGGPLDVVMDGPRSGYVSLYPDTIAHFQLPDDEGEGLSLEPVASGLAYPRGLALSGGTLFATLVGPTLCPDPAALACLPDQPGVDTEVATIEGSSGSVVGFAIQPDGSLGDPTTIVTDLPVTAFDHGVNALDMGPDGRLYATVGGLDGLSLYPEMASGIEHDNLGFVGTVLTFEVDGSDLRVFADGLRNVYDIAFSPDGTMYGVDNDGEALNSVRKEEVLRIIEGGDYGWPADGTFAPFTRRNAFPSWIIDQRGSSGVEWSEDFFGKTGLVTGAMGSVRFVEFGTRGGAAAPLVGSDASVSLLLVINGFGTSIDQLDDGRLLVGVFSPWAPDSNALLVVSADRGNDEPNAAAPVGDEGDIAAGSAVYESTCAACHGADAEGIDGLGKPLAPSDFVATTSSTDLLQFLKEGRPASDADNTTGIDMPARGGNPTLSDQNLLDVAAYIKSLN